ncbi:hypothetical protein [Neorhizobium tomejilense]|uniref:hypothetical protein n=1 Tax=Neorhizobium tomejilense TaxID=2093828 RepID=UPI003ED100D9
MAKHLVIAVDWFGPYKGIEEARVAIGDFMGTGLYLAIGRTDADEPLSLQYVGISTSLSKRVGNAHHKLGRIDDLQIWVGEVGTARPSGRQLKKTPATLDYAEWLMAYFVYLPLNDKKTKNAPDIAATLLNRWWKKDYETPYHRRPHPDWPDLIDYLGFYYPTKIVWFGKKLKRVPALT